MNKKLLVTLAAIATAAAFGLVLWAFLPASQKWIATAFLVLLLCRLCYMNGYAWGETINEEWWTKAEKEWWEQSIL
ncbi:hypothetical protein NIES4074_36390 [Cylindrospermum sp. NIES-4074]|nr:hypothetical protein NIES4074_36390 [Cylindrospermum sp. NIES-4074]